MAKAIVLDDGCADACQASPTAVVAVGTYVIASVVVENGLLIVTQYFAVNHPSFTCDPYLHNTASHLR